MSKKKIQVLVIPSDRTGVSKFRSVEPHMKLQELYDEDFHIDIITAGTIDFTWDDDKYLSKYDIVHFHRTLPKVNNGALHQVYLEEVFPIFDKLKSLGIITVMDLDDYWAPSKEHPAYDIIQRENLPFKITENIKKSDYIITTTPIFAEEISKFNSNVVVLPNAIDPSEKQFNPEPEETNKKVRFGWLGGSSHLHDLKLMDKNITRFLKENKDDVQFVLCGFDTRGNITEFNRDTGEQKTRRINPEESVWSTYELMFTDNYKILTDDVIKNLKKYDRELDKDSNVRNNIYRRVWTKPITTYASNYNLFDVSMAPLKEHMFNKCKSQLKVIEAGFHKKALIAQDYGPYQIDLIDAVGYGGEINPNGNALLIDPSKNHKEWYRAMKRLYDNPELREMIANNLYNTVKDTYHINTVTKNRSEFYKTIVEDKKNEVKQLIEEINED